MTIMLIFYPVLTDSFYKKKCLKSN